MKYYKTTNYLYIANDSDYKSHIRPEEYLRIFESDYCDFTDLFSLINDFENVVHLDSNQVIKIDGEVINQTFIVAHNCFNPHPNTRFYGIDIINQRVFEPYFIFDCFDGKRYCLHDWVIENFQNTLFLNLPFNKLKKFWLKSDSEEQFNELLEIHFNNLKQSIFEHIDYSTEEPTDEDIIFIEKHHFFKLLRQKDFIEFSEDALGVDLISSFYEDKIIEE
ncbi:hypothetical protein [Vibrio parahaemolyticus]|uniref:hypothetical protein n=1 Tax=Vibrio parahaemolyticus TaxID=670 RepID=UPI001110B98F|nr:hypothetical protein [Vibrio parahaemolyticus]TMX35041.1 hypothetical protein DA098_21410 [Vibrio parahaemolyticus]TMX78277.1 hypothetical protein DA094_11180 [Vibrio parahaemolyticus]